MVEIDTILTLNRTGFWGASDATASARHRAQVLRNGDIGRDGALNGSAERWFTEREAAMARFHIGDVAMTISGDVGKMWLADQPAYHASNFVRILRPDSAKVLPAYLYYMLQTPEAASLLAKHTRGATIQNLAASFFGACRIPLPPLPEQRRVGGILDEAYGGIATAEANARQNLRNALALFESQLDSVLRNKEWSWKTLGDLCDGVEYGSSAKSKKEGEIPVLRMGNIQNGQLDWDNLVYTSDEEEIKKYLLNANDVLFNRTNSPELVGKTAIYRGERPAIFAGYLIRICRKKEQLDAEFLTYFLNSKISVDYGRTVMTSSVNQANINGTKLKGYPIPAPTLLEQRTAAAKLNEVSEETQHLVRLYDQKLAALESLKKSLLHEAFTGQL